MRNPVFLLTLALFSCAPAVVQKQSFTEALRAPYRSPPPPVPPKARALKPDPRSNPELHAALSAFSDQSEAARVGVVKGARMSDAQVERWETFLPRVEALLAKPMQQTSAFDNARARLVLGAQLEADAQTYGDIPAALAERVQKNLSRLSTRLSQLAQSRRADPKRFFWPLEPVVVTSPFGHRFHPLHGSYKFHNGTDLAAEPAQSVYAAFDGVVVFSGWNGGYGKQIELQHDRRWSTRYAHLQTLLVEEGTRVRRGDLIGLAGSTGNTTGPHLHFEVMDEGLSVDAEAVLLMPGAPALVSSLQTQTGSRFPESLP